ncbi:MAG: flagellar assembly protein FliX [Hyphomicrobiales bacterium]
MRVFFTRISSAGRVGSVSANPLAKAVPERTRRDCFRKPVINLCFSDQKRQAPMAGGWRRKRDGQIFPGFNQPLSMRPAILSRTTREPGKPMRIGQAMRSSAGSSAARSSSASGQGREFRLPAAAETQTAAAARGPATVTSLEAILALQSVEEGTERRKRAARQGSEVLDLLEDLRLAILSGRMPAQDAAKLRALMARWDGCEEDPALAEILKQIDLRAQVEIAKLDRAGR